MSKSKSENITIVLADDHPLLRKGLKEIIDEKGTLHIVGEAGDGEQALKLIQQLKPDIAIIDINMPKLSGLEVVKMIKQQKIKVDIIVLTMYDKENIFNRAMDLGVKGYIMKDAALTEIVDAIKNVASGKYFISSSISGLLVKRSNLSAADDDTGISKLTTTELKILRLVAANMTTKEIADELFISNHTVDTHRSNICSKLKIRGTNALLHFVLDHPDLI